MNPSIIISCLIFLLNSTCVFAQKLKSGEVPKVVIEACKSKYPDAKKITWEKEKGNYEANWGGKSGEENSVQFTPSGQFIEIVKAIRVSVLPKEIISYVREHYKGARITEAGKVTDAKGNTSYEVEVNHKDLIFDMKGKFLKEEKE